MEKETRNAIERMTQQARRLLEDDFSSQLEGTFDVLRAGVVAATGGKHLSAGQLSKRHKVIAAIEHKQAAGMTAPEAVAEYIREGAFTTLNRFVALKMLEARELVQECITKGEKSSGYREFCGLAPGVAMLSDSAGYRLFIESLFDELSTEVKVLFDRRDPASVLWPKRATFETLLDVLNTPDLSGVWGEDETIGWVYQFFNSSDERKKMREESQAPRNSHELAVRNQFFTPRYVVEFLVDNTLGRTWLQMHGDGSDLPKRCRYFVASEEERGRVRPRKDPRDLRVLDPACGSGHFLLYCFDLLLTIYEEAWAAATSGPLSHATGQTLRGDYPDLTSLRRAAPALILEYNLHAVDIDPRAAQIAALALWLRAQRAWKDLRVPAAERPPVHRTHVIVAEPIPGDGALVEKFAARLDPPLLGDLFRNMVSEMRLAGELGTLIPVEEGIAGELRRAREKFVKQRQTTGRLQSKEVERKQGQVDTSGGDDGKFFHEAETLIVEKLREFAEAAANGASVRRRLFAEDATEGIALIDLLRTRFDVVLMNPPFGSASLTAKRALERAYPRTKNDIYAAFVERGILLLHPDGLLGAITSRTGFFLSSFQKWREEVLLKEAPPVVVADLGGGVMDGAMVEAAAYCLQKGPRSGTDTVFLRAIESADKATTLLAAIRQGRSMMTRQRFDLDLRTFTSVPRSPFAYWVSERLRRLFQELPGFEGSERTAKCGAGTLDDFRFLRLDWEPHRNARRWIPFAKGGAFSRFYSDLYLRLAWAEGGSEIQCFVATKVGSATRKIQAQGWYFRPGLTWPRRTQGGLSLRAMPGGCIFADKGPAAFVANDDRSELLALLAVANSSAFSAMVDMQMAFGSYEVGVLQRTPVPRLTETSRSGLARLARRAWSITRGLDTRTETSHAFTLPALLHVAGAEFSVRAAAWTAHVHTVGAELGSIQAEIDERCFALYRIDETDRRDITEEFVGHAVETESYGDVDDVEDEPNDVEEVDEAGSDPVSLAAELVSWAVGVAFGRFDVRLANGRRPMENEPDPFDPLPACSPGMLTGRDGLPLARRPPGYPIAFPEAGFLVADLGHAQDLGTAVRAVFDAVFGTEADRWLDDVAALLDSKDHELRVWLASGLFEHHLKRYSKSRRKAPIFWQLGTPSGRYSVWLYAHRLTRDTLFQIQNDVIGPKFAHEERRLTTLTQNTGGSPSASERKKMAAQEAFVEELRAMLDEVKRVAPLWNPSLDDGVVLTMAPLWRLVPQHKAWQREIKSKWDELVAEKYDWAHLAMHLWPERVVPKCATDRSLAIAHGLEEVFWIEGADGKWKARSTPTRTLESIVRERTSPAVRAALKDLLNAPAAGVTKGRGRGRRSAQAAA